MIEGSQKLIIDNPLTKKTIDKVATIIDSLGNKNREPDPVERARSRIQEHQYKGYSNFKHLFGLKSDNFRR